MLNDTQKQEALRLLAQEHPDPKPALHFRTPFELLIATVLSAQCTDKQVNKVTAPMFQVYNTPEAFAALTEEEVFTYIHTCGLYKAKGRNIIALSKILVEEYDGQVPKSREELIKLPGVGRKTANVVLSNAFGIPAIAVDTHVFRVANRIGLTAGKDVRETEEQLMQGIPQKDWADAHHWLIYHGREVCSARGPKCAACAVKTVCETYRKEHKE